MKFAKIVSKVRANVIKEKEISLTNAIKEMEKNHSEACKALENLNSAQKSNMAGVNKRKCYIE